MGLNRAKVSATRDPEKTAARILAAALEEFAAKGFAGARVDAIARRAGTNKRMLYHYFGGKDSLFRSVLHKKISERQAQDKMLAGNPADNISYDFMGACQDPKWVRMLQWEALQNSRRKVIGEAERRAAVSRALKHIREGQTRGHFSPELDSRQLLLTIRSLSFFPIAFPQLTRLITGRQIDDPKFQRERANFLRNFAIALRPRKNSQASLRNGTPVRQGRKQTRG